MDAFRDRDWRLAHWIWALPVLLFVTWMSARQLDLIVPEVDEFYGMYNVGIVTAGAYTPLDTIASVARYSSNHTPFYFILLNLWSHLVGGEIASLRLLTVFIALLSLAMVYRLARDFAAPPAGLLALIVAVSTAFFNFYYTQARMYALLLLLAALVLWLYLRIAHQLRAPKTRDYVLLGSACYLLANTHASSALLFSALGLYHLLHVRKDRRWLYISLAVMAALLLFSPWLSVLLTTGLERSSALQRPDNDDLAQVLAALQAVAFNGSAVLLLLSLGGIAIGWRDQREAWARLLPIVLYFLVAFGLVELLRDGVDVSKGRLALAGWPPLIVVIAAGFYSWVRWRKWLISLLLLWIIAGISFQRTADWSALLAGRQPPFTLPAWHIVSRVARQSQPSAPILSYLVEPFFLRWGSYIKYSQSRFYFADRGLELITREDPALFREYVVHNGLTEPFLRVFYQTSKVEAAYAADLNGFMSRSGYEICDTSEFGIDTALVLYGWPVLNCKEAQVASSQATELIDYEFYGAELAATGDRIYFVDKWNAKTEFAPERINLSHQLISADWELVAQLDLPLVHEKRLRQFSIDLSGAPAGRYRLMAILYDSRSSERFDWIGNRAEPPYMQVLAEVIIPE
ncbi:MAG: glycosyltransferase family 39 protein [Chloroflexi bacterium]|nr:glycosyltransferase family 39 protein [Chloroflexota bacterium]